MTTYVALLRGINVGGKNMISMKDLKARFERLGFTDVTTYINSGNILFRSTETDPRALEEQIDAMLVRVFKLLNKTVVRSQPEMERLLKTIAKTWPSPADEVRYNVVFLRHTIDSKGVLAHFAPNPAIDTVTYCPGTLLWSARVDGTSKSALEKLGSKAVFRDMTVRNLNTTRKVLELMQGMNEE